MLDDFLFRAMIAGAGVAAIAGPLGCFIVWQRLAYFGDTLAHAALLGVALALLLQVDVLLAVFVVCAVLATSLLALKRRASLSADTLLGLLAHSALALGLVCLAFLSWLRVDLMGLLFGDILAVSKTDLVVILVGGGLVLCLLAMIWRPLFAATVSEELAEAEGMNPQRAHIVFVLLLASVVAVAMKIVGVLLVTALLVIPAAAARRLARSPEQMAVLAGLIGICAVISGLFGSLRWDTPSGPTIVIAALGLFLVGLLPVSRLFGGGGSRRERGEAGR